MSPQSKLSILIGTLALTGFIKTSAAAPATLGTAFTQLDQMPASYNVLIDGNTATTAETVGRQRYTFDAGSAQPMQGIYLWTAKSNFRNYWAKIETSSDGHTWETQWRATITKTNSRDKPSYFPFPKITQSIRYVRVHVENNLHSIWSGLGEARWLAHGQTVAIDPDIPAAHWHEPQTPVPYGGRFYPSDIADAQPMNTPFLVSWSLDPTNYLSKAALYEAAIEEGNCPKIGSSSFYPETVVIDATGEMPSFKNIKFMPDGTRAVVLDWSHVDLSHDYGGSSAGFSGGTPTELGTLREGRDINSSTAPHPLVLTSGSFCDGNAGDAHYGRGFYYQNYWQFVQTGSHTNEVTGGWDGAIPNPASTFSSPVSAGLPFERVHGDDGKFGSIKSNTVDGFVDIESRWSNDENGSLTFVSGPSLTAAPAIRGLYVWMHRSNKRRSTISITARADTESSRVILPPTLLPQTSNKEQPVFIPIEAGNIHYKHITITGHGNNGGGNSSNVWSSIAEVRYSNSSAAPVGIPAVSTLSCIPFTDVQGSTNDNAITTNNASYTVDGSTASLNYWASNQPSELMLDTGSSNTINKVKIWMHKSHIRTSNITLNTYNQPYQNPTFVQSVHLPLSPMNQAETITLTAPTSARYIGLNFNGNSQSSWNSISEVCWE